MKESKTSQMIAAYSIGDMKSALRIFKTFRLGLDRSSLRIVEIAYECHTGKEAFYLSIGLDTKSLKHEAIELLMKYITKSKTRKE